MNRKMFALLLMMTSLNLLAFSSCQSVVDYQIQFTSDVQTVEITSLYETTLHLHHDGKYQQRLHSKNKLFIQLIKLKTLIT